MGLPNRHLLELPMDNLEFRISMEQRIEIIIIRMLEEEREEHNLFLGCWGDKNPCLRIIIVNRRHEDPLAMSAFRDPCLLPTKTKLMRNTL